MANTKSSKLFTLDSNILSEFEKLAGYGNMSSTIEKLMSEFIDKQGGKTISQEEKEKQESQKKAQEEKELLLNVQFKKFKEEVGKAIIEKQIPFGEQRKEFIVQQEEEKEILGNLPLKKKIGQELILGHSWNTAIDAAIEANKNKKKKAKVIKKEEENIEEKLLSESEDPQEQG